VSVQILQGDARARLATLPAESVQCVVTSPPYFQLRDYGVDGQIGLEATPAEFIAALVEVFEDVRRVLRPDGVVFVNLGDSYSSQGGRGEARMVELGKPSTGAKTVAQARGDAPGTKTGGIPSKNLLLIPQRFAIAMQDAGWYVRSQIAWCKTSAMPESVRDRPTSAWESIWMLTKSPRYFWDQDAVRQPNTEATIARHSGAQGAPPADAYRLGLHSLAPHRGTLGVNGGKVNGANLRNYWLLGPEPSREEHYAAFPSEIPRRCILAASRPGDTILDPFLGSGTTALVADQLGRNAIGCELNPTYAEMARRRITNDGPMFADVQVSA